MLEFKKTSQSGEKSVYELSDEGEVKATVETNGNTLLRVRYFDENTEKRCADFTLRSIIFILRNNFAEVKSAFYDVRLEALGMKKDEVGGGMSAPSIKITFDNCCCQGGK